ncbi:hypothetical protein HDU87_001484, partial [Geranomyces variabilis]
MELENLLDADLKAKIPMSATTLWLALKANGGPKTEAAWNTVFSPSNTVDMLLGMTVLGSPSLDACLNSKNVSKNDCQIVTDSLVRETIYRLQQFDV